MMIFFFFIFSNLILAPFTPPCQKMALTMSYLLFYVPVFIDLQYRHLKNGLIRSVSKKPFCSQRMIVVKLKHL